MLIALLLASRYTNHVHGPDGIHLPHEIIRLIIDGMNKCSGYQGALVTMLRSLRGLYHGGAGFI